MAKDFTPLKHQELLESLLNQGYKFITFYEYLNTLKENLSTRCVILRHDVEKYYQNALVLARIQNNLGIVGSYYFRILPHHYQPEIIKEIAALGHEIGYHYDDLAECGGDPEKAILRFKENLMNLREIAPVKTICMDGSPLSKFDNKDLWRRGDVEIEGLGDFEKGIDEAGRLGDLEKVRVGELAKRRKGELGTSQAGENALIEHSSYHYSDFGIIGEPYYDMDFNDFFYITDTGRRWDGWKTSVRDKVAQQEKWNEEGLVFHSTQDIIAAIGQRVESEEQERVGEGDVGKGRLGELASLRIGEKDEESCEIEQASNSVLRISNHRSPILPNRVMFTFHPQRWHSSFGPWAKELVLQNAKNVVKRFLVKP